jgi:hypothetical protein
MSESFGDTMEETRMEKHLSSVSIIYLNAFLATKMIRQKTKMFEGIKFVSFKRFGD